MVRSYNLYKGARFRYAMDFFHSLGNRLHVLNDMNKSDTVESIGVKRVGIGVKVVYDIDLCQRCDVHSDTSRVLVVPAPKIQNRQSDDPPDDRKHQCSAGSRATQLVPLKWKRT